MDDLISIVLPVYNGEKYLRESIDSILAQSFPYWELLIMDDCSTDSSSEIAKEYAKADPRIHYYRNEANLRLPKNLNKGFSLAKGNYLTWTSDDNRYKPQALEVMYNKLQETNAGFAFATCRVIDDEGKEIEYITVNSSSAVDILGRNSVGACFLYTREVYEKIGDYDAELELVEDYDYWQRIFAKFKVVPISDILYEYRWHKDALSSTMRKDIYHQNLERMLLKNRPMFGKINIRQKLLLYNSLSQCREEGDNPYRLKAKWYSSLYFYLYRVPGKIKRTFKKSS